MLRAVVFGKGNCAFNVNVVVLEFFTLVQCSHPSGQQEMTAANDHELRQKEHECNLKMDEMRTVVLSHDLKVRRVKVLNLLTKSVFKML